MKFTDLPARVRAIVEDEARVHQHMLQKMVSVDDVMSGCRKRGPAWARQAVYFRLRELRFANGDRYSLPHIGNLFGVDHSSVHFGIKRVEMRSAMWHKAKRELYARSRVAHANRLAASDPETFGHLAVAS